MSVIDVPALRRLIDAATSGPWEAVDLRHQRGGQIRIFPAGEAPIANVLARSQQAAANAEFIAAARQALPAVLDEIERLRGRIGPGWYPQPGDVWADQADDPWICNAAGELINEAGDVLSVGFVTGHYGPLRLVYRKPTGGEPR